VVYLFVQQIYILDSPIIFQLHAHMLIYTFDDQLACFFPTTIFWYDIKDSSIDLVYKLLFILVTYSVYVKQYTWLLGDVHENIVPTLRGVSLSLFYLFVLLRDLSTVTVPLWYNTNTCIATCTMTYKQIQAELIIKHKCIVINIFMLTSLNLLKSHQCLVHDPCLIGVNPQFSVQQKNTYT